MPLTVQDVIDTIMSSVTCEPVPDTVDTLKAGDPSAPVRGIATTFIATLPVLRRAVELGANMVITHEPTFYGHRDETQWLEGDPAHAAKRAFIDEHGLAIWRFHDHWHMTRPDGIVTGVLRRLGWEPDGPDGPGWNVTIPATTVRTVAAVLKERLGASVVRIAGDPEMQCTRLAMIVGAYSAEGHLRALRQDDVDVVVVGEAPEWITCEWVRDAVAAGLPKAAIFTGHCASEEPGMEYLVEWLGERLPDVPVTFVPAGDPFAAV